MWMDSICTTGCTKQLSAVGCSSTSSPLLRSCGPGANWLPFVTSPRRSVGSKTLLPGSRHTLKPWRRSIPSRFRSSRAGTRRNLVDAGPAVRDGRTTSPAIRMAQSMKPDLFIAAAFPPRRKSSELRQLMPRSFEIYESRIRASLLPEVVSKDGRKIRRPAKWNPNGQNAESIGSSCLGEDCGCGGVTGFAASLPLPMVRLSFGRVCLRCSAGVCP